MMYVLRKMHNSVKMICKPWVYRFASPENFSKQKKKKIEGVWFKNWVCIACSWKAKPYLVYRFANSMLDFANTLHNSKLYNFASSTYLSLQIKKKNKSQRKKKP